MAFGGFERHSGPSQPMSEINVTPLVDVMLVLLVIFIITAPLLSYAIKLDLPNDPAPAAEAVLSTIKLSIDADGKIHVDTEAITDDQLRARFLAAAKTSPVPEVHVRADDRHARRDLCAGGVENVELRIRGDQLSTRAEQLHRRR